jgi:uncharacterized protein
VTGAEAPWELILAVVVAFAAVQSVFGVGMLVFGTPTLLVLGLPFDTVLAYLLPCSLVISALQVGTSGGLTLEPLRRQFLMFTAPAVVVATAAALFLGTPSQIGVAVGGMLVLTAALRMVRPGHRLVSGFVHAHLRGLLVALGVIHGASNLGGGMLAGIVGALYDDKVTVRRHIAFCYGLMASLQFAVVLVEGPAVQPLLWVALPFSAAAVYIVVGQWLFGYVTRAAYQHALTSLLAAFGVMLVLR